MQLKEIYERLCYYDKRNPNSYLDEYTEEELSEARNDCSCDNCFYGRNELALELIKTKLSYLPKEKKISYLGELQDLKNCSDIEIAHINADNVLCSILEDVGLGLLAEVYNEIPKLYA